MKPASTMAKEHSSTLASPDDKNIPASSDVSAPLIHEGQRRQLCGVSCINNLLQLSTDAGAWVCGTRVMESQTYKPATKQELDEIADSMTLAENRLLSGDTHTTSELSLYRRLRSNHRTVVLGNYSFEVIETALQRRGVQLEWYQPTESVKEGDVLIGFVVNEAPSESQSLRKRVLRSVGRFLGMSGGHWYAITSVRRVTTEHKLDPQKVQWRVIDSDADEIVEVASEAELMEQLRVISKNGGNIFRATLSGTTSESTDEKADSIDTK